MGFGASATRGRPQIFLKIVLPYPRKCPTGLDKIFLEMITKILLLIDRLANLIHPRNKVQPCFARQEEFYFVKENRIHP
jgi:hypothetical protein